MSGIIKNMDKDMDLDEISVINLKIDYELMTLFDAIQANEPIQVIKSKYTLKQLQLNLLEKKGGANREQ